ncbi:MAG TPA: triose-phosphate isomerase [Planctomycetaceae bacterium]|jgi:triosephosphate isomerase|nr:triose-phosphate isomerase [Planctomycetaceae bacterium]
MSEPSRRKLVAGNWKMNTTRDSAVELARGTARVVPPKPSPVDVLLCPPFPYLCSVGAVLEGSGVLLGAQNVCCERPGAFTGEVAVDMLTDVGCRFVIVGHSERRHIFGETNHLIQRKVVAAIAGGLDVILCVGEQLAAREANQTEAVLDSQMTGGLTDLDESALGHLTIAYEPCWAIGTGQTATPQQAQEVHLYLRKWLADRYNPGRAQSTRILYGGSVNAKNALELLSEPDVDGALVGGASLKVETFRPIIEAAAAAK